MQSASKLASVFVTAAKWRRILVVNFFIFAFLGAGISLLLPKWYKANSTIIPSNKYSQGIDLAAMLNPFAGTGLDLSSAGSDMITFLGILKSRTIGEAAVKKFNLIDYWGSRNMDDALITLDSRISVDINNEGFILLEVEEKDPVLAADLVNFMVAQLDSVNKALSVQNAKATREFLEARVNEMMALLNAAEDSLRDFQEKNGAYSIPEQTMAMIQISADLQAQIYALEVKMQLLQGSVNADHPELLNSKLELKELKSKLNSLEGKGSSGDLAKYQIPFAKIPEIGMEFIRLTREVEKFGMILQVLYPQLENAKLEEVKNTPTIQVLDTARPALLRFKPTRSKITMIITFMGMALTVLYIIIAERWNAMRQTDEASYRQIDASWKAILTDAIFWKKRKKQF